MSDADSISAEAPGAKAAAETSSRMEPEQAAPGQATGGAVQDVAPAIVGGTEVLSLEELLGLGLQPLEIFRLRQFLSC